MRDLGRVAGAGNTAPLHVDEALGLVGVQHVVTVGAVHGDAAAARDVARDGVAGEGPAAGGEAGHDARGAEDVDAGRAVLGGGGTLQRDGGGRAGGNREAQGEAVGGHLAAADGDEHVVEAALAGEFEQGALDLGELQVQAAQLLLQLLAAAGQVLGALPLAEPLADLGAGVVGLEVAEGAG